MIASIVPVKRLPRDVCVFDYLVPKELEGTIKPGQLVEIEFRKTKEFGIVLSTSHTQTPTYAYKPLQSIIHEFSLIPPEIQKLLQELALIYGMSLATLYKTSILPLQKRKLTKLSLTPLTNSQIKKSTQDSYFFYSTEAEHAVLFSKLARVKTALVLVPEVNKIALVAEHIRKYSSADIVVWHSELGQKEKYELWLKIRNNTQHLVILGTRSALMLPFPHLDLIIVDYEHSDQYKNYDQQPRFHSKDVISLLSQIYQVPCVYASFSPSFDFYYKIVKKNISTLIGNGAPYTQGLFFTSSTQNTGVRIVEHTIQKEHHMLSIATEDALIEIGKNATEDAVVLVQRKGYATMVVCKDCGHIELSTNSHLPMIYREDTKLMHAPYDHETRPLPLSCGSCGSTVFRLQGIGTEKVAAYISHIFKKAKITVPVFRIDDNAEIATFQNLLSSGGRVLVGTEKVLPYIQHERTRLYVLLDLDHYLMIPEYTVLEHVVHLIDELNFHRNTDSELLIETTDADKHIFKLFHERDRVYRTELSIRQKLGYPPYQNMIKYTLSSFHKAAARKGAIQFRLSLAHTLTSAHIPATVSEIYETHPNYDKGKYWYGVLIKTNHNSLAKIIALVHTKLPRECTVDVNPISILSP